MYIKRPCASPNVASVRGHQRSVSSASAVAAAAEASTRLSETSVGAHGPARIALARSVAATDRRAWHRPGSAGPPLVAPDRGALTVPCRGFDRRVVSLGLDGRWGVALGLDDIRAQVAPLRVGDRADDPFRSGEVAVAPGSQVRLTGL
jgi:hypothetical protein